MRTTWRSRRGLTWKDALAVLTILGVMSCCLMPTHMFGQPGLEKARQTRCMVDLKQISNALRMYRQD